jgi:predicted membrane-bound spermidine synthase
MVFFIILGLTASIYQLVLLREFTFSIAKNELSLVVAIGVWIIFCSLGSLAGLKKRLVKIGYLPLLYTLVFSLSVGLIHLIKKIAGLNYYEIASFGFIALSAFIFFGCVGFLIGYSFSLFCRYYLGKNPYSSFTFAKFFGGEALGYFIGGLIFTFFLASYRNPYIFSLLPAIFYFFIPSVFKKKIIFIFCIAGLSLLAVFGFKKIIKTEFQGAQIKLYKGTPYGPIIETRKDGVSSFYLNGSLAGTSQDLIWDEKFIHTTLSAVENTEAVLFIGPSFSGQLKEILKYKPDNLDYISSNKKVLSLIKEKIPEKDKKKINFIATDPRKYLVSTLKDYDCIIMNKPPPASLFLNRFYSLEFFKLVKDNLKDKGVFSFSIPSKRDILSPHILKFNSCILNTVERVFPSTLLSPSDSMIILASQKSISASGIFDNFSKQNIKTDYLTIFHLKDYLAQDRRGYIRQRINPQIKVNRDYYPLGFLYCLLLQQAKFYPHFFLDIDKVRFYTILFFIFLSLGLAWLSIKSKKINYLVSAFVVGFSSIAMTGLIFIIFQAKCGALFEMLGILTGLFMLGLSGGTFLVNSILKSKKVKRVNLAFCFGLWVLYIFIFWVSQFYLRLFLTPFLLYIYSLISGLLTGAVYPLVSVGLSKEYKVKNNVPVLLYAADLGGAFFGTLIVSVFLIPFLGVPISLGLIAFFLAIFCFKNIY